ncbi:acyl carrier protein [Haematospirillum jordaniae]|uniref:Acyl carrier protein n=1 Tax=Haematospirillum jordaniae TaxID=1549855 RepID=A0A143DD46_9PROT|nr:acyl carrier protein [Haematospirillum jordaniae]AMW34635.1 acyl carrier protein [Haematospirillum jordaniae]NKD44837.1 acyl carrier protein [Haematospirillum jordaniae]NKD57028.1 acyl carrier protein [Haematospirillum jordaniae]NKD58816.1 acyl carrier protein [Haematospirillum jordaniae]NKD66953.1 acyl carrier protein [Haematospirillum jordaniae]
MSVRRRLIDTFLHSLDLPEGVDVDSLAYRAVPTWDSVGHMQLVAAIENTFEVMMETQDIIELSSFDKAIEILERHGVDASR